MDRRASGGASAKKSRKPYTEAEIDLYNLLYDGEEQPPDLEKFRKTLKRKRIQGRVELVETLQKWRNHPDATVRREAERKLGQMAMIARKTRGDRIEELRTATRRCGRLELGLRPPQRIRFLMGRSRRTRRAFREQGADETARRGSRLPPGLQDAIAQHSGGRDR